jgi:hypothetical protein
MEMKQVKTVATDISNALPTFDALTGFEVLFAGFLSAALAVAELLEMIALVEDGGAFGAADDAEAVALVGLAMGTTELLDDFGVGSSPASMGGLPVGPLLISLPPFILIVLKFPLGSIYSYDSAGV